MKENNMGVKMLLLKIAKEAGQFWQQSFKFT
uniref:Uncharacterized protein n=1 Tax=Arundo donax TaxID=35708 RepID=A0A0A9FVH0_ARUDO